MRIWDGIFYDGYVGFFWINVFFKKDVFRILVWKLKVVVFFYVFDGFEVGREKVFLILLFLSCFIVFLFVWDGNIVGGWFLYYVY